MFKTDELNLLFQVFTQQPSHEIQQQLHHRDVNLEATLLRAKVLRSFSPASTIYMIQADIEWDDLHLA